MKRITIKSAVCATIFALALACSCCANTSLKQIAKPYTGEYECKSATLGDKDLLSSFAYIKLELKGDGTYILRYKNKMGRVGEETGQYTYDIEKNTLSITHGDIQREIPIIDGKIFLSFPIGGKEFVVQFARK